MLLASLLVPMAPKRQKRASQSGSGSGSKGKTSKNKVATVAWDELQKADTGNACKTMLEKEKSSMQAVGEKDDTSIEAQKVYKALLYNFVKKGFTWASLDLLLVRGATIRQHVASKCASGEGTGKNFYMNLRLEVGQQFGVAALMGVDDPLQPEDERLNEAMDELSKSRWDCETVFNSLRQWLGAAQPAVRKSHVCFLAPDRRED